ncbi:MAG: tryptophan 2,3-dioxygenase [Ignavibacteriaceae bacterium]|nr:tryptophan 2,3-dioxygenase [Ignavibacteriaceae bacterium]
MKKESPLYYADYLELDKILTAQHPKSASLLTNPSHDETLFIIVHQAFELWFLQIIHELKSVIDILAKAGIDDNSDEMGKIVQRLDRVVRIIKLMNSQFEILETMQPLDFLEFRGLINPSSGFQSKQFRLIEAMLGLQINNRHMPEHYKNTGTHHGGFSQEDYDEISEAENSLTLLQGLKKWLNRMPFFDKDLWSHYQPIYPYNRIGDNKFASDYFNIYDQLQRELRDNILLIENINENAKQKAVEGYINSIDTFKTLFIEKGTDTFSANELITAMFIMLYRQSPMLRLPFAFINSLVEIDELLSTWRYKHYLIVRKMIGSKVGTGGSIGAAYLLGALQKNNVFSDITLLATYFLERDKLPVLPKELKETLNFRQIEHKA